MGNSVTKLDSSQLNAAKLKIANALAAVEAAAAKAATAAQNGAESGFGGVGAASAVENLKSANSGAFGTIQQRIDNIGKAMGSAQLTATDLEADQARKFTNFGGSSGGN